MNRRGFLGGIIAAAVAPAIIRTPGLIMPIKPLKAAYTGEPYTLTIYNEEAVAGHISFPASFNDGDTITINGTTYEMMVKHDSRYEKRILVAH